MNNCKLAIVNRSFWPVYPVIGEALLRFAEKAADNTDVSIIMQDHADIRARLVEEDRGRGVRFYPAKAWTTSSSSVFARALDAVFFMLWVSVCLLRIRPNKVYVSTDPPVIVPFLVMVYCKVFGAEYIYHLQDIHPEAANIVVPVNKIIYRSLRWMDCAVMRNASRLITITENMADYLRERSGTKVVIDIVDNPAVSFEGIYQGVDKIAGFSFCGNAGRLQRVPLLVKAIEKYLIEGGTLKFAFAGAGVFSGLLKELADKFSAVTYFGLVDSRKAAQINVDYEWALLPIDDEVTRYAFPSKTSSYVFSGARILAICGRDTSVSKWVENNKVGLSVEPEVNAIVSAFREIERSNFELLSLDMDRALLKERLKFDVFVSNLFSIVLGRANAS